jgi:hypothetical protein
VAVARDEERVARSQVLDDVSVPSQCLPGGHPDRDAAFVPSLAHNPDQTVVEADVLGIHADQLGNADQGVEKHQEDRSVPDAQPGPLVGNREQSLELLVGKRRDDRLGHPGHLEVSGDVLGDVTEAVAQPAQGLQDLRVSAHGVGGEAPTTALQDEPLQVGQAKVRRIPDPLGGAPVDEPSGPVVVPLDGPAAEVPGLVVGQELLAQILQRDFLPRHRSSSGADHAASSSPREDGGRRLVGSSGGRSEDLSGAGRKEHRKTCVVDAVRRTSIGPSPRPPPTLLGGTPLVTGPFQSRRRTGIEPAWELSPPRRF